MLKPPPRDENGKVIPHDHRGILPDDGIIRRIPEQHVVVDEKIGGKRRISSMAFKCSSGQDAGMSVDLQRQIEEAGLDAKAFVTTPRWVGSIRFRAAQLRSEGFKVGFNPIEADPNQGIDTNPYHGEVWGSFTRSKQKRLRQLCEWFVPIDGVSISDDNKPSPEEVP